MNKTIHQLDEIESLATSDELAIWDNSASGTKKVPASEIKSLVITATSTTVTGAKLMAGSVVKIMFTLPVTGSDTTAALRITYNGSGHSVKVGKDGSLADLVAHDIGGTYTYLQAYTTLDLAFDGTQFIVIGNPVVISNSDYTIYADGETRYKNYVRNQSTIGGTLYAEKSMYFYLRNLLGNPQYGAYRFKFYLMGNAYNTYYCEGHIAIYEYSITIYIDSKSSEISSVTWDSSNEQMQVVVTDAIYAGSLSVASQDTWVPCP